MSVAEMRILRFINENTWKDRIRNEEICLKIGVAPIDEKIKERFEMVWSCLEERNKNEWVSLNWEDKKGKEKTQNNISRSNKKDLSIKEATKSMTLDKIEWKKGIHVTGPN